MRILFAVMIVFSVLSCKESQVSPIDETFVDVKDYKVNYKLSGKGDKGIILIPGLGDSGKEAWEAFAPKINDLGRILYYDPSGLGKSSGQPNVSYDNRLEEIHILVEKLGIPKPYVLVAHSISNWTARLYIEKYRSEVSGLVLLDPTAEERDEELAKKLPAEDLTMYKAVLAVVKQIFIGYDEARDKVKHLTKLDDLPTAVVYAEKNEAPSFSKTGVEVYLKVQEDSQRGFKGKFKNLKHFEKALGSGHYIQNENPEAAMSALKKVLAN